VWSGQHLAHNAQRQNAPAHSTHYFAITIEGKQISPLRSVFNCCMRMRLSWASSFEDLEAFAERTELVLSLSASGPATAQIYTYYQTSTCLC
jgi:hypothetical protein